MNPIPRPLPKRMGCYEWLRACLRQRVEVKQMPVPSRVERGYYKVAFVPPYQIFVTPELRDMPVPILMDYIDDGCGYLFTWDTKMRVIPLRGKALKLVIKRIREVLNRGR